MVEYISGIIAFVTTFIGLLPQVYKSLKTKSAADLSMTMLINYVICSIAWIVYASAAQSFVVLASNVVGLVTAIILIIQKYCYDARNAS
jgi:MtN3 and saliva related transmembrane protein